MSLISRMRSRRVSPLLAAVLLLSASAAQAAFTHESCLAKKRKELGKWQQCRATEEAKILLSKPADPAKCTTKFLAKIAKLSGRAREAGIACRFVDNGNSITDYHTGLTWVKTNNGDGSADYDNPQDADNYYRWGDSAGCPFLGCPDGSLFTDYLYRLDLCTSTDGSTQAFAGFAGRCDWRLPTPAELQTILDTSQAACGGSTGGCIDPIFGPNATSGGATEGQPYYWTSTTVVDSPRQVWIVAFGNGTVSNITKGTTGYVRAVRGSSVE